MKPRYHMFSAVSAAVLLLTGCTTPLPIYYKQGVAVSRLQTDTQACQIDALKQAPVSNQVRQDPPIFIPGRQYCNSRGCYTEPPYWIEGRIYTVDVNTSLRFGIEQQCMGKRGYQPVSIPACKVAVERAAPTAQTQTLPALTDNSCAIKYQDGTFQIVNSVPG